MGAGRLTAPALHPPIEGPRLHLRPLTRDDLSTIRTWRSDPEVERFWGRTPTTDQELWDEIGPDDCYATFAFAVEERGRGLGVISYWHRGDGPDAELRAGVDIYLGGTDSRDRGVGTEAVRTLLAYLFDTKHVHRVTIDPEVDNARAIRAYEKAGFRIEGVLRHNDRIDGRWVDTHFMAILEDEWPAAKARWQAEPSG